ncbi:MAG TPA: CaiB/BaiF CoA-transferase family protein [Acidimicrobiales bacterium]|nr:CaiB/BaiF CoA-transferase family protein [Acidimicrobiales bacterium]
MPLQSSLAGLQVLDLTRNLAGPYCTMLLGDLGADVVKIEAPGGDDTRAWTPPDWNGESPTFLAANRNKRSISVDLDHPDGAEVVRALADRADVVVESFRPGALDRRGLGYDATAARNPSVVWCSISAFGRTGPLAGRPGYDPVLQARTGIMSMTGFPDAAPARLGIGAIDLGTGLWATVAIQAALAERARTGAGTRIDTSLYEVAVWWLSYHLEGYLATGQSPQRGGTSIAFIAPYEVFPTSDGGGVMVAAANDNLFANLCRALGVPELTADPRFVTNADRVAHRDELRALVVGLTRAYTAPALEELLDRNAVPCSRVRSVGETAEDEQTAVLGMLVNLPHPRIPDLRLIDMPVSEAGARAALRHPPPLMGEHTDAVLAELGYTAEGTRRLRDEGAVS